MMTVEEQWEARYQDGETGWDRGGINPLLRTWMFDYLCSGDEILVPGCGNGHEVIELARAGFDVIGLDIASTPLANLQQALDNEGLHARVIQTDMFEYERNKPFDAIYEQTSLCAIEPGQRLLYEEKLWQWLKPGGALYAMFMQTDTEDGPPFHCDVEDMKVLFDESRWKWGEDASLNSPHPSGRFELAYRLIKR